VGLDPGALSQIFVMFSQVTGTQDRSEGGLGIGLALAKGLMRLHNGTIEAKSAGAGRGSEFIVRIPHRAMETEQSEPVPGALSQDAARPRQVLIADDNRDAAASLAMLLEIEGHSVAIASTGTEALEHIATYHPDVALLDIGMPKPDGYEVARLVRADSRFSSMMLIAVTGWGQEGDKLRAREAGFDLHFTKPVDPAQILNLLCDRDRIGSGG
jgi:CheY-like chemotaxis protein